MDVTGCDIPSAMYCLCYQGNFKNSLRDGFGVGIIRRDCNVGMNAGTNHWELERRYEGEWSRGYYHGHGKLYYKSFVSEAPLLRNYRVTYSGEFYEGVREGMGALVQERIHQGDEDYDAVNDYETPLQMVITNECNNMCVVDALSEECDIDDLSRILEGFHLIGNFICGQCSEGIITSTTDPECYVKFKQGATGTPFNINCTSWTVIQVGRRG